MENVEMNTPAQNVDVDALIKRVASTFNTAHVNNRAQLAILHETLVHWQLHGDSRPVRLMLTRANGKPATRITARPEKLQTYAIINRITRSIVDGALWKFNADEQTGMVNPSKDRNVTFDTAKLIKLEMLVNDENVTIISKAVREAFPSEKKSNPTLEKRVAAETKWCKDNGIALGDLIAALQAQVKTEALKNAI